MAYLAPIHRPSSVRHALKLNFLIAEEDCLVVAKANRLEFYSQNSDGLSLQHSKAIYGKVTMLQKLRPAASTTDHLFVGTDRFVYFTLSWDPESRQLRTEKKFESVADKAARESQTGERCLIDPTGRFMTLELYEGIITVVPLIQKGKKKKQDMEIGNVGEPVPTRITEMFVRSSAFLHPRSTQIEKPKLALLYEDLHSKIRLKLRQLAFSAGAGSGDAVELEDVEGLREELELGASHLIPISEPAYGLLILGETSITYYDDSTNEVHMQPLEEATIFVTWERVDSQRFVLADDYGRLYLLMLVMDGSTVQDWKLDIIGQTSRASVLIYLDAGQIFVGSHQGDSQVIRITEKSMDIIQTFANIAPILDFTIMDMGNRSGEGQSNEYSSGQARIVTGSGAYQDGSLRSVRSGVGLEDLGVLGEMEHISNLFSLKSNPSSEYVDTLLVTFVNESRVFRFDSNGEVEEVEEFKGMILSENTLLAANISQARLLQVTSSRVQVTDLDSGMVSSEWTPSNNQAITAASANDSNIFISLGGVGLVVLDINNGIKMVTGKVYGVESQVACIALPPAPETICFVGFWQNSAVSVLDLMTLKSINTVTVADGSVPRSLLLTKIFENKPPTLFIAMADGNVVTFAMDPQTHELSGKKSIVLGTQQATFRALPRGDGLFNVFATCEHPSLIYGSEGRIIYSAVTAEKATSVCSFDSESYPGAIAIATSEDLRIALVDAERTTHVQTLLVNETVRRIAYSPSLKAFGMGTIKRILKGGVEIMQSHFKLADEILFKELDTYPLNEDELVESVMRCELDDGTGSLAERFVVGTAYLEDEPAAAERGRIIILEVTEDRMLKLVTELSLKGGCRCLAMVEGKIVAALIKTVVIYSFEYSTPSPPSLTKCVSFRTSTAPIDVTVNGDTIVVADLMKSVSVVQYKRGEAGLPDTLTEIARHFQTTWGTAVAEVAENTYLESDAEGNLMVLYRDTNGVTDDDKRRLQVSSEMLLGEMANRIRRIEVLTAPDAAVIPRAFIATVEGSLYLFALITPSKQNLLITLQSNLAELVKSPGDVPFNKYRAFKNQVRESDEPNRFVDGDLIERFLDCTAEVQEKVVEGLGVDVEGVRSMVEALRRLH